MKSLIKHRSEPARDTIKYLRYPLFFIFLIFIILFIQICSPTDPVIFDHQIHMRVETEVTEAWIYLQIDNREKDAATFLHDIQVTLETALNRGNDVVSSYIIEITKS